MRFRKFISLFSVALSSLVVLATSQVQYGLISGDFDATSDCINPVLHVSITVNQYQVVAPAGVTYLTLGFPTATVIPDQESTGTAGAVTRRCTPTYSNPDDGGWVYSCFDNNELACTIYIKKR
jgi:hypothetical protein